ncbi:hypothetical protein SAMN05421595_2480 [Austwickia chelonae]|nr:hypothetical protein SAMN05421595_2480 [Austwickia chelonae]
MRQCSYLAMPRSFALRGADRRLPLLRHETAPEIHVRVHVRSHSTDGERAYRLGAIDATRERARCAGHVEGVTGCEYSASPQSRRLWVGSSPQVRGACRDGLRFRSHRRLIPAGAGRIRHVPGTYRRHAAHPRRCGAHSGANVDELKQRGSSPQVRGAFVDGHAGVSELGLIPAGAGRIPGPRHGRSPRTGSSPQVRGA